jgi:hypothetical protein
MLNIHHDESRPSRVTVAFEHGAISFMMSKDATFEDLADRLDRLGKRRHGKPVAIAVKLAARVRRASTRTHPGTWSRSRYRRSRTEGRRSKLGNFRAY